MANLGAINLNAKHVGQIGSDVGVIFFVTLRCGKYHANIKEKIQPSLITDTVKAETELKIKRRLFTSFQTEFGLTYQQAHICEMLANGKSR
jgi:hypothetical protein